MIIGSTMDNLDGTYVICMLESVQDLNFRLANKRPTFSHLKGKSWLLNHVIYLRNWDKLSVYSSIFEWWMTPILPSCKVPNGFFFGITVNFSVQVLKNKHLVCVSVSEIYHVIQEPIFTFLWRKCGPKSSRVFSFVICGAYQYWNYFHLPGGCI